MQNQHKKPVLIFAQSGRLLAQSATQAGYRVWVADCFGDQDTLNAVERWIGLPALSTLSLKQFLTALNELTNGEPCSLICGSGIEYFYHFLNSLPDYIELVGNKNSTIQTIKTPSLFFNVLHQLDLAYPDTFFERPINTTNYIAKSASGLGGNHIQFVDKFSHHNNDYYFQERIDGDSGSVLFLADGNQAQLIGINRQYTDATNQMPYRLGTIEAPWKISVEHQQYLCRAIVQITIETALTGLNSLDFILSDQNEILILEINPRPSASAELINAKPISLFQSHINACLGILLNKLLPSPDKITSLRYLYADDEYVIPSNMTWPKECNDIPTSGNIIKKGEPICTSLIHANSHAQAIKKHYKIEQQLINQFTI